MKLPNGYGSVTKLSGSRRKPYLARVTVGWEIDEKSEKCIQKRISIGTYKTKKDALQALSEYGIKPYDIQNSTMTLTSLYEKWSEQYYPSLKAKSSIRNMQSAWNYLHTIHTIKLKDLRTRHIKNAIESAYVICLRGANKGKKTEATANIKINMKLLMGLMLDYALEFEWIDRNYARSFKLSKDITASAKVVKAKHIIFSDSEMSILWDNVDKMDYVNWILIQCYMGWRPQELIDIELKKVDIENKYIIGGMKTNAGKNRVVPIHPRIFNLVKQNYDAAIKLDSNKLINDPYLGSTITYHQYALRFKKVITALELNSSHRAHDPRKTFVTMAKKANVDDFSIKKIVGHTSNDITETVYTERNLEWIRRELEKIP